MNNLLIIYYFLHALIVLYMFFSQKRLGKKDNDVKKDPLYKIIPIILFYGAIFSCQLYAIWVSNSSSDFPLFPFILGSIIFLLGYTLRVWAIRYLGPFFTMEIGIRRDHKVIKTGPYSICRHPSYLGYLLMTLGFGLATWSAIALFVPLILVLTFLKIRIKQEDEMLTAHFGDEYLAFIKKKYAIIPFLKKF